MICWKPPKSNSKQNNNKKQQQQVRSIWRFPYPLFVFSQRLVSWLLFDRVIYHLVWMIGISALKSNLAPKIDMRSVIYKSNGTLQSQIRYFDRCGTIIYTFNQLNIFWRHVCLLKYWYVCQWNGCRSASEASLKNTCKYSKLFCCGCIIKTSLTKSW